MKESIKKEALLLKDLRTGDHPNIIRILKYGWLRSPHNHLYIDMELCDLNLHVYIHGERPDFKLDDAQEVYVPKDASLTIRFRNTLIIMKHISDGLKFIHDKNHVHRDLKPRNGSFIDVVLRLIRQCSSPSRNRYGN